MSDLLVLAREHDLPPKWNGIDLTWDGWRELPDVRVFVCFRGKQPPPDHCGKCGSIERSIVNRGAGTVFLGGKDRHAVSLMVFRCPDCHHDLVSDETTGEWWDLDHTDYGPEGSR